MHHFPEKKKIKIFTLAKFLKKCCEENFFTLTNIYFLWDIHVFKWPYISVEMRRLFILIFQ